MRTSRTKASPGGSRGTLLAPLLLLSAASARPGSASSDKKGGAGVSLPHLLSKQLEERTYDPARPSETCHQHLSNADADGDGIVQNFEYLSFVADLSEGDFDEDSYSDLPFVLKVNFVYLSCLCGRVPGQGDEGNPAGGWDDGDGGCCTGPEGGIFAPSTLNLLLMDEWEAQYLHTVCTETQGAIDYARDEAGITKSPTPGPTGVPTGSPTDSPTTSSPTLAPSTAEPTDAPSAGPVTSSPTSAPTAGPVTSGPTGGPTAAPATDGPTAGPTTLSPTASPDAAPTTSSPTRAPVASTGSPTAGPTGAPTDAPVDGTVAPTAAPTSVPTVAPIDGTVSPTAGPTRAPVGGTGEPTVSARPSVAPVPVTLPPWYSPEIPSDVSPPSGPGSGGPGLGGPEIVAPPSPTPGTDGTEGTKPVAPPSPTPGSEGSDGTQPVNPPSANPGGVQDPGSGGEGEDDDETLSLGAVVGIILGSCFIAYSAAYLYHTRRKRDLEEDPELQDVRNKDLDDLEAGDGAGAGGELPPDGPAGGAGSMGGGGEGAAAAAVIASDGGGQDPPGDRQDPPGDRGTVSSDAAVVSRGSAGSPQSSAADSGQSETATYDGEPYDKRGEVAGGLVVSGMPPSPKAGHGPKESDSSSAGESGWSSSAGMSSLHTASFDAGADEGLFPGSPDRLLAAAGAATETAGTVQRESVPSFLPVEDNDSDSHSDSHSTNDVINSATKTPLQIHSMVQQANPSPSPTNQDRAGGQVTRGDLNAAIEAGDWAMVGATAALLADSTHDYNSLSGSEVASRSMSGIESRSYLSESSDTANRTKELDKMVERGDWEGVVLAAAQFEGNRMRGGKGDDETTLYSSRSGQTGESRSLMDIRAEVERLVRRVVPDEIDNIDEMMLQFEGREEELIETLRTMQERSVAQRARAAVQKTAKLEAKAKATIASAPDRSSDSHSGSLSSEPEFFGSDSVESSSVSDLGNSHDDSSSDSPSVEGRTESRSGSGSSRTHHSSLELAIEKGDWRAVGEAAAMMGDGEEGGQILHDSGGSLASSISGPLGRQERVSQLDVLIAKGDWAGIVATAGTYQAIDDQEEVVGAGRGAPTEEERNALAQADMWSSIAQQSKPGGTAEAGGAADAADWAISRSLEQMKGGHVAAGGGGPDPKKPRVGDDESV